MLYRHVDHADRTGMQALRQPTTYCPTNARYADRWFLAALVAITLAALSLRLYRLGYESLDMDELVQVKGYSLSPYGLVMWAAIMGQPILDYVIGATLWRAGLAGTDAAVRIPAVLFGTGGVLLFGLWSRQIAGRGVGLAAAVFLAVCPFHIILSQQARQYTLFLFFALATLMVFDRARRLRSTGAWILFSVTLLALLMTRWVGPHVITIGITGYTIAMWAAAHRSRDPISIDREKGNLYATTAAMTVPYLVSIPMYVLILQQSRGAVSRNFSHWIFRACDHLADAFFATFAGYSARTVFGSHSPEGWFVAAAIILLIVGSIQLVRQSFRPYNRHSAIFLASLYSFPILFAAIYACLTGAMAKPQYLLLMVLPVFLSLAIAAKIVRDALATRSPLAGKFAFAVIVCGISVTMYSSSVDCLQTQDKRDWRAAMTYLREHASASDAFAVAASDTVPAAFVPLAYGKHRYGIPQAKFLPIRQSTQASVLMGEKWQRPASATWVLVYTDRMYLGYDQIRPPTASVPAMRIHRFNGLFLIESRAADTAAGQLMDAIALLYRNLPSARSLIAPALLQAKYLKATGQHLAARRSLGEAFRQCRDEREVAILGELIETDSEPVNWIDARADATPTP